MGPSDETPLLIVLETPPIVKTWQQRYDLILQETMGLFHERILYRDIIQIIKANRRLPRQSVVYAWLAKMHAHSASSSVRRLRDEDTRTLSLWRLLNDIAENPTAITREWFVSQWASGVFQARGHRMFDQFAGPGGAHVRSAIMRRDQRFLEAHVQRIKNFVDQHVAHHDLTARKPPTFAALDVSIRGIQKLVAKYGLLLRHGPHLGKFEPVAQEDWRDVLRIPWVR